MIVKYIFLQNRHPYKRWERNDFLTLWRGNKEAWSSTKKIICSTQEWVERESIIKTKIRDLGSKNVTLNSELGKTKN